MEPFANLGGFIIDMDGVLWEGKHALPGLLAFFQTLRAKQLPFILATNNASATAEQYVHKLAKMGVTVALEEIITSGMATASYLSSLYEPKTTKVFVVGEDGATLPLLAAGFSLTDTYDVKSAKSPHGGADIVVCGKDETLSWDKLATATLNIRTGAKFFGTNGDISLPTELGVILGNGAILAALEVATGVKPIIIGKPEPIMYQQAIAKLGIDPAQVIAIGDRLDTDILGAVRSGIRSILVLTGISTTEDLKTTQFQPTWVLEDIRAISQVLETL